MEFKNIKQEVFELKDIKTLVETLRVEVNEDFAVCYDLEAHAQRLLGSILELDFELAKGLESENFTFFLLNSVLSPQICVLLRNKNILCTKINFA